QAAEVKKIYRTPDKDKARVEKKAKRLWTPG
ncbi:unnamed protein product, partial [marine sediment metagenome]